jgi:hypothetical protein
MKEKTKARKTRDTMPVHVRRNIISELMAKKMDYHQIHEYIKNNHVPTISEAVILDDIKEIDRIYKLKISDELINLKASQYHEIQELKIEAWRRNDYRFVMMCLEREAKLLGLDSPLKITQELNLNINVLSIEEQKLFIGLYEKAINNDKSKLLN